MRTCTPSVASAEGAVDIVTVCDVAGLDGIAVLPEPICVSVESVRLTESVWPSQVSLTPETVTEVIS